MSGLNKTINLKIKKGVNTIIRKIKGKWKNLKEDYKSKPLFYKNKNQPLKMVYNAQEVNVLYGGDFSKKFKKLVRKAVREGKRFSLPRIRTFKDLAINRSGNIVNKNKAIVEYQHNFTVKIKIVINNDGKTFVKENTL